MSCCWDKLRLNLVRESVAIIPNYSTTFWPENLATRWQAVTKVKPQPQWTKHLCKKRLQPNAHYLSLRLLRLPCALIYTRSSSEKRQCVNGATIKSFLLSPPLKIKSRRRLRPLRTIQILRRVNYLILLLTQKWNEQINNYV